ncbi:hypothetical protein VPH35_088803 [Triticum aestivum]
MPRHLSKQTKIPRDPNSIQPASPPLSPLPGCFPVQPPDLQSPTHRRRRRRRRRGDLSRFAGACDPWTPGRSTFGASPEAQEKISCRGLGDSFSAMRRPSPRKIATLRDSLTA